MEMWRTVIIDDEQQVIDGLKATIPWEGLNMVFVGAAYDGEEGIELAWKKQPDIIVTDIYMPVMNGLDMIHHLVENGFVGRIVILSGYNDFEYARQALRLRVDEYLSKPVSRATIQHVFERLITILSKEADEALFQKQVKEKEPLMEEVLQKQAIPTAESFLHYEELADAIRNNHKEQAQIVGNKMVHHFQESGFMAGPSTIKLYGKGIRDVILYAVKRRTDAPLFNNGSDGLDQVETIPDLTQWFMQQIEQACPLVIVETNVRHRNMVQKTVEYIHSHYQQEQLILQDIAEQVGVSRKYLGRVFTNTVGESFKSYVTRIRMEKAKQLLLEGELYIYEIADRVGYSQVHYFTRQFKQYYQASPSEMIKRSDAVR